MDAREFRTCPQCGAEVDSEAVRCFHCGFWIWLYENPAPRRPELE